jgi:hypothetical protein
MTRIVVLFNLKEGVDATEYEQWAKDTDLPTVNALPSIRSFTAHKSQGLLTGEPQAPYQYIEVIDVEDMGQFGADVSTDAMQKVAAAFQSFADQPLFILTEDLG